MRFTFPIQLALVAGVVVSAPPSHAQQPASSEDPLTLEEVADRVTRAEGALGVRVQTYHPIVEVYIQNLAPDDKVGSVPVKDEYFLGQFDWDNGPKFKSLSAVKGSKNFLSRKFSVQYLPDGFAAMSVPDWHLLDRQRYDFRYIRREFVGEARCIVLDVKPKRDIRDGFSGRIWVEDRDYNIVRFNGISRNVDQTLSSFFRKKLSFHVDSWRVNVLPGFWLPSYVYCEETDLNDNQATIQLPRIKAQVRLWGYESKGVEAQQQFTAIRIDEPAVRDSSDQARQLSPVMSQRRWEQEAEENVLERLNKSGLLSPPGDIDKVLETVVTNLEVTNGITIEPPVRCRVLLTSPLETFTLGHTIVISRGLIDVLPDEASLATMLAHELAHIVLGHPVIDTKFAFADRLMVPDGELLRTLQFHHEERHESAADTKVIEMLKQSPYKDKLANVGLFLRAIAASAKQLTNLIQPHMGDHIAAGGQLLRLSELVQQSPELAPERLDQIAALPLGARLVVNPWSGRVDLARTPAVPLLSAREKTPLSVTPLMPYITYAEASPQSSPGKP
jgi:hypothetical protein